MSKTISTYRKNQIETSIERIQELISFKNFGGADYEVELPDGRKKPLKELIKAETKMYMDTWVSMELRKIEDCLKLKNIEYRSKWETSYSLFQ